MSTSMPKVRYDRWAGETELVHVVPRPLDAVLSGLCRRFTAADEVQRRTMRTSLSTEDVWTLITFAGRSAVFALRERSQSRLVDGLTAIAMIDARREDPRDMPPRPIGLVDYVAGAIGANPDTLLREAARLSTPEMADLIERYSQRPRRGLGESLYMMTETPEGPGFVETSVKPYGPARPLDRIAVAIGEFVASDSYGAVHVSVRQELPRYWLEGIDDAALSHAMRTVRGGATVHADLRPEASPGGDPNPPPGGASRILTVFLIELRDEAAGALLHIARAKGERWDDVALLGVQDGRVFCLLVARSCVRGVPPIETWRSLQRFEEPITAILRRYPIG
jgi:hypothetical protein